MKLLENLKEAFFNCMEMDKSIHRLLLYLVERGRWVTKCKCPTYHSFVADA